MRLLSSAIQEGEPISQRFLGFGFPRLGWIGPIHGDVRIA